MQEPVCDALSLTFSEVMVDCFSCFSVFRLLLVFGLAGCLTMYLSIVVSLKLEPKRQYIRHVYGVESVRSLGYSLDMGQGYGTAARTIRTMVKLQICPFNNKGQGCASGTVPCDVTSCAECELDFRENHVLWVPRRSDTGAVCI